MAADEGTQLLDKYLLNAYSVLVTLASGTHIGTQGNEFPILMGFIVLVIIHLDLCSDLLYINSVLSYWEVRWTVFIGGEKKSQE
jgi:hypothetical protein